MWLCCRFHGGRGGGSKELVFLNRRPLGQLGALTSHGPPTLNGRARCEVTSGMAVQGDTKGGGREHYGKILSQ